MNNSKKLSVLVASLALATLSATANAEVLCKNKKTTVVTSRPKTCLKTETKVQSITHAVKSTSSKGNNTTGLDLSVTRTNATSGTVNTTGLNLSVVGDTGADSTNVGLIVSAAGADNNYSAIFQGGNVGIGVADPDESLEVAGRLHLGQTSAPTTSTDKLYNVDGILYWNGQAVATGTIPSGTITGVTAGTGLTGGGTSGTVTLSVDAGTSANDIVQLNSSAQLPAVSGANLTALNASSVASGTLSDSRLSANVSLLGSSVSLASEVSGTLPIANGGTGATTLADLVTLGTHTTGSYVQSVATGTGLTGGAAGSEGAALSLALDLAASPTWTQSHSFTASTNFGTTTASAEMLHLNGRMHIETSSAPSVVTNKLYNIGGELYFSGKNLSDSAQGGDITGVTAGTGLTGGGTTGDVPIAVDVGTSANQILQLNGSAQIPAVSGINLTALNASNIASGTLANARLNSDVSLLGSAIDLTSEVTGILPVANGGIGASSLSNLITLSTHTTGDYVASASSGTGITVTGSGGEASALTVAVDTAHGFTWTNGHVYSGVLNDITTVSNQDFSIIPNGTGNVGIGTNSPSSKLDTVLTSTSSSASTQQGSAVTVTDTGAVASGTDTTIGSVVSVTRTGGSAGTFNTTGVDINVTGDAAGTSTTKGLDVNVQGGDVNYAAIFTGGRVGIGTSTPTSAFQTLDTSTDTTAATQISNSMVVTDTGVVTTGTDASTGLRLSLTRTGATGGTISSTGLDITVEGDAGGTSSTTGLSVDVSGADNNVAATFAGGSVSVGGSSIITSSNIPSGSLVLDNGTLCIDDGGDDCADASRNTGTIYAANVTVASVDLAEEFPIENGSEVDVGDIVMADTKKAGLCVAFGVDDKGNKYCTDEQIGTVPFVAKSNGITSSNKKVLGVVSTKPGMTLGGFGQEQLIQYKKVPLALAGRVPVNVSLENGAIEVGDRITPSSTPGVGRKANQGEYSIGIALESMDAAITETQKILVLVK